MPILLIVGLISLLLGLVLFFAWFGFIVAIIKAVLPAVFIGGGAVAAYLGWEEMNDQKTPNVDFSSTNEAKRYKSEAMAYREKMDEIVVTDSENTAAESSDNDQPKNKDEAE